MSSELLRTFQRASQITWGQFPLVTPLVALVLATVFLEVTGADLAFSQLFYDTKNNIWPLANQQPWQAIDDWCILPGMIIGISAFVIGLVATLRWHWTARAHTAVLLAWVLIIGPGLLVNAGLKPFFSRPRPREITHCNGAMPYEPVLGFGEHYDQNSSFPSGHASIGFYLIAPAFACRKRSWRWGLMSAGLLYGSLMSLSRIVQGAHYLSDTLWSLGIVYTTAWLIATIIRTIQYQRIQPLVQQREWTKSPLQKAA